MSKVTKESKVLAALQANTAKGITAAQMTSRFGCSKSYCNSHCPSTERLCNLR